MKKINLIFPVFILGAVFLISSCRKNNYGNTDINHTTTLTLNNWVAEFLDEFNFTFSATADCDEITQDVVDNGVVLVYSKLGSGWMSLPFTVSGTSSTQSDMYYNYSYSYSYSAGKVNVYFVGFDDSGSPTAATIGDLPIKVVTLSAHQVATHPDVNLQEYDEVKEAFDL